MKPVLRPTLSRASTRLFLPALAVALLFALAATLMPMGPAFRAQLLIRLIDPNLAIALLLCGILLLYAEFNLPGTILPGALGALLTMLAIFGLSHLPLHAAAIESLALGFFLLLFAVKIPRAPSIAALYRDGWDVHDPNPRLSASGWTVSTLAVALAGGAAIAYGLATLTIPPVHPAIAIATATAFSIVTLWLGRVALLARHNKLVFHRAPHLQPSSSQSPE